MKMKHLAFLLCLLFVALNLNAQQGGYKGPGMSVVTVAEAKKLRDDTPVVLQGKIERFLGDEKYLFADDTGNIVVEIDDRIWGTLSVDNNDSVEITGEVDKDFMELEIDVKAVKKI